MTAHLVLNFLRIGSANSKIRLLDLRDHQCRSNAAGERTYHPRVISDDGPRPGS